MFRRLLTAALTVALAAPAAPAADPPPDPPAGSFVPHSVAPTTDYVTLAELPGHHIPVTYQRDASAVWVYPVFVLEAAVPEGGRLTVRVRDVLNDPRLKSAFEAAVAAKLSVKSIHYAEPTAGTHAVGLYVTRGGRQVIVARQPVARAAGQPTLLFDPFVVPADALARGTDAAGLVFTAQYQGRYHTTNLTAATATVRAAAVHFVNDLGSTPDGEKATFLFAVGGTVKQKLTVAEAFAADTRAVISLREGADVPPELLMAVVKQLFTGVSDEQKFNALADRDVVTLAFDNGVKLTATVGTLKGLSLDQRRQLEREVQRTDADRRSRSSSANASVGFAGVSLGGGFASSREDDTTKVRNSAQKDAVTLDKFLSGDLPCACLNVDQVLKVSRNATGMVQIDLATFAVGQKTVALPVSFQLLSSRPTVEVKPAPPPPPVPVPTKPVLRDPAAAVLDAWLAQPRVAAKKVDALWLDLTGDTPTVADLTRVFDRELARQSRPPGGLTALWGDMFDAPVTVGVRIRDTPPRLPGRGAPPARLLPPTVGRGRL